MTVSGSHIPERQIGLVSEFKQSASAGGTVYTDDTYTWSQDPAGNPYISTKVSVTDPGHPTSKAHRVPGHSTSTAT